MRRVKGLLTCIFCACVVTPAISADPQWVEVRSRHFSVVTDAGDKRGRDVAVRFEQMRSVFGALLVKAKVSTPVPLQIIAFRNSKELRQFSPLWRGKATELAGLFQGGSDRCFIMLDMSVENPWQVVFHEYAHQLMNGTMAEQLDPWFEEGFAEYFRTITVDGKEANVGKVPEDEYYILEHGAWLKTSDLLRVRQDSSTYHETGDRRSVFYAESGMLVHYLYDNELIPKLGEYFSLVRQQHVSTDDAFQKAFGVSPTQFDKVLRNYATTGRFKYYKLAAPSGIDGKTFASAPINLNDAQAILADVHLHSSDYQKAAEQEFESVLRADPNNATALRGMGYACLMKHDYPKAGDYFSKSAQLNGTDARVLYYSALLSQQEAAAETRSAERLKITQSELEKSIQIDPEFADAHNLLAFVFMSQGNRDKSIAELRRAIELSPRNEQYRFQLAHLYIESSKFDEAASVLRVLRTSSNADIVVRADDELRELQRYKDMAGPDEGNSVPTEAKESYQPSTAYSEPVAAGPKVPVAAQFLKGTLRSIDCSQSPQAMMTIVVGSQTWMMRTANVSKAVVIGADQVSCEWKNQKVAINYRQTGEKQGDIISLELQ